MIFKELSIFNAEVRKKTGLLKLADKKASTISEREQRRLEITPSLNTKPSTKSKARWVIQLLKKKGIGILITDHNAREIISIVDKAYLVADGKVLMKGTAEALLSNQEAKTRYFGEEFSL